ncbi:MAG: type II secretion system ATPase GspE [Lentisphaeria bacterium]|nr:type II secretion system ATPase GspE [Lentisphaeria bacterium]MBR4075634.1 type II secretion system ATPase GspE [Lentisphaeria bacterium]
MVTPEQVDEGWQKVSDSDGRLDIIEALQELKYVDRDELMAMLAQQYGLETLDLTGYEIPDEIIQTMTPEIVRQYNAIPVMVHDDILTVAMSDPTAMDALDGLRYVLNRDVEAVISPQDQIQKVMDRFYGSLTDSVNTLLNGMETGNLEQVEDADSGHEASGDDAPIIRLVYLLITEAYKMKASDIHLEPLERRFRVRYRIDGVLREMESPPKYLQSNIISRIKIMSRMDLSEKRIPQDGRIQVMVQGVSIDLRVSDIPTTHGESIVMRILDKSSIQLDIPQLGFYTDDQEKIDKIIGLPDGIFLVTGPTGSGKTTSLYAFLNTINTPNRKIITVEDPVEYQLAGINQVQVNPAVQMTFANALRAMLRQAPNIIMVGEIRDLETAEIAINASLTGHLVFSTLHTNDAPSAVTRLIDMGVKPFLVASSVRAIMAQRLVRRVCKKCAQPYTPTADEIRLLGLDEDYIKNSTFMKGRGCSACGHTGYKGRMGIYEIFILQEEIQNLIYGKAASNVIRDAARKSGMRTLREDGLRKAAAGTTTLAEVLSTTIGDAN